MRTEVVEKSGIIRHLRLAASLCALVLVAVAALSPDKSNADAALAVGQPPDVAKQFSSMAGELEKKSLDVSKASGRVKQASEILS